MVLRKALGIGALIAFFAGCGGPEKDCKIDRPDCKTAPLNEDAELARLVSETDYTDCSSEDEICVQKEFEGKTYTAAVPMSFGYRFAELALNNMILGDIFVGERLGTDSPNQFYLRHVLDDEAKTKKGGDAYISFDDVARISFYHSESISDEEIMEREQELEQLVSQGKSSNLHEMVHIYTFVKVSEDAPCAQGDSKWVMSLTEDLSEGLATFIQFYDGEGEYHDACNPECGWNPEANDTVEAHCYWQLINTGEGLEEGATQCVYNTIGSEQLKKIVTKIWQAHKEFVEKDTEPECAKNPYVHAPDGCCRPLPRDQVRGIVGEVLGEERAEYIDSLAHDH